jgi:hypothetical protein
MLLDLGRLNDCGFAGLSGACCAGRIRLIWTQLWVLVSAQLVEAACHPKLEVARYAEDMLHALATKLLDRTADLVHYR